MKNVQKNFDTIIIMEYAFCVGKKERNSKRGRLKLKISFSTIQTIQMLMEVVGW